VTFLVLDEERIIELTENPSGSTAAEPGPTTHSAATTQEQTHFPRDEDIFKRVHIIREAVIVKTPNAKQRGPYVYISASGKRLAEFIAGQLQMLSSPVGWQVDVPIHKRATTIMVMYVPNLFIKWSLL